VERLAKDVGVSASELRRLVNLGPDSADLLLRRMAALDLDRNELSRTEPRTFQDLQRVCTMCNSHRRCSRDLARDSADPAWQDYCPNAATLMALNALPGVRGIGGNFWSWRKGRFAKVACRTAGRCVGAHEFYDGLILLGPAAGLPPGLLK
jgi:hypothetical protein